MFNQCVNFNKKKKKNSTNVIQESANIEDIKYTKSVINNYEGFNINQSLIINKSKKRGIIYLSTIPKYMNVTKIREIFSTYGEIERVYLQLANSESEDKMLKKKKRKGPIKYFTEGWIEFKSKKVAKFVAATLNNKQISSRKKSRFYDALWNIKYLPGFIWTHLSERLAYERAVHKQRLRTEIDQTKREVNFFSYNIDRSKKLRVKFEKGVSSNFIMPEVYLRETEMDIKLQKNKLKTKDRIQFLQSLLE